MYSFDLLYLVWMKHTNQDYTTDFLWSTERLPELAQARGLSAALTRWSPSSTNHSRWCFIVGHKWLSASVCLPASNLWFRDSLRECTSSDSADNSIWENDPSFLVRHKISHLTSKLLTRGTWKKEGLCQPSWCFLYFGSRGLNADETKRGLNGKKAGVTRHCQSFPHSGTRISSSDLLELSIGQGALVFVCFLIFRTTDFVFSAQGFHQTSYRNDS